MALSAFLIRLGLGCAATAASLTPVAASTITWDLGSDSSTTSTSSGSGFGNVRTFTSGGVTVTVTAWADTGTNQTFQTAASGRWSTGLGICNQAEGQSCGDPAHQVDNGSQHDFMMFSFSSAVEGLVIGIDPYGAWDRDVTFFKGMAAGPLNLTGISMAALNGIGLSGPTHSNSTVSDDPRTVSLNGGTTRTVLFGARAGEGADASVDRFKIKWLSADVAPRDTGVPEPGTLTLLGSALFALGLWKRRRT